MKPIKQLILLGLLFLVACESSETPESFNAQEIKVQNEVNSDLINATNEFIKSPLFNQLSQSSIQSQSFKEKENNNGAFIVQQGVFAFFPHYFDGGVVVVAAIFESGDYKILPNELAEFNLNIENPLVLYIDDANGLFLSANECIERNSTYSIKYKGQLLVIEDGETTTYRAVLPLKTAYIAKGRNMVVNDADEFDEETGTVICREENVTELAFDFMYIEKLNNEGNATETSLNINFR